MDKHISSQFDSELNSISSRVLELGGVVESQIASAVLALTQFDATASERVYQLEKTVNQMEVDIDRDLSTMIVRRQPAASDLRFLIGISKTTANLERAGDEATKIARMAQSIIESGASRRMPVAELRLAAELASKILRSALDALARLDVAEALLILREDDKIDIEFNGFVRKLVTFIMEDARTISPSLDLLFVAKALERIGDHAKNIAEMIIYIVKGEDVRHIPLEDVQSVIG
ncbi:MAG: phosphate signaling complex protein PhoU [Hydrogenophaga sp.]|jgi:phosphate transport system protein|uniref:phosphate signaling complex protein PhoU n=1 Tax=Hydrogenophaga sp. TaxID=1904254 RepID=UPI00272894FE|nr:phosphate signaling complex protein PhoU [Hydrogenophaga sp.]MDO9483804.1 phosphate signaling complex protein PhoU [Hydrogenophaga sp.]MDP1894898.1 phosphate signaling complex protein PhoU [Hydrogenophaga sp.]MDP2094335.1 phosphate signaling complex protein PhoU [Hydrogenophaga sp.]MDP3346982.1 phosphate signaling complex protein PhoU [Hydrogenophaga sp.]MDP3805188.1 phosphate signaling complex protein PhoU [Hydrogenophaga sp.]